MQHYNEKDFVNVGCGEDLSIKSLAEMIQSIVGYQGDLIWNTDKPDGTPRKLMDVSKIKGMGWSPKINLEQGIANVYREYQQRSIL
jgi:GDP-L-fucose synthase